MDMTTTVHELRELKRMREELDAQITTLEDILKEEMSRQGKTSLQGTDWKVTWPVINASRLDQKLLKELYPEAATKCTVPAPYRRFTVK